MRLLLDMDGPLADFDRLFFERCKENGWEMDCELENQSHRFATAHIPDKKQRQLARDMVDTAGWFTDLPVTEGAINGLAKIWDLLDVWIVSKPLEANPTCRDDKYFWLLTHFGEEVANKLILAPDKSIVYGDILLDDAPRLEWFVRATWSPVIYGTSWNGEGSKWADLPRWNWNQPIGDLLLAGMSLDRPE